MTPTSWGEPSNTWSSWGAVDTGGESSKTPDDTNTSGGTPTSWGDTRAWGQPSSPWGQDYVSGDTPASWSDPEAWGQSSKPWSRHDTWEDTPVFWSDIKPYDDSSSSWGRNVAVEDTPKCWDDDTYNMHQPARSKAKHSTVRRDSWGCPIDKHGNPIDEEGNPLPDPVTITWQDGTGERVKAKRARDAMDEQLRGWPWRDMDDGVTERLAMLCPLVKNNYKRWHWILPESEQTSPLFKFLRNTVLRDKIMDMVMRNHFDTASFVATCQAAFNITGYQFTLWDVSARWFNRCERPRFGPGSSDIPCQQGSVQSVLIITQIRHPQKELEESTGHKRLYSRQLTNLKIMVRAVHNFCDFLQNAQFHRVPFLTIELLNLLVPGMRNLKVLGVYKCLLINVGHTMELLDIIKVDKPLEKEHQVYLDFFPNYHLGPTCGAHEGRTGSYGVLWDNWGADTRLAIWALVSKILPRALSQGIDMAEPGTAFRRWLEMSPCWAVEETLKAIMTPDIDPKELVAFIDWPHYEGKADLVSAWQFSRPEGWKWSVESYRCETCDHVLIGCCYGFSEIREARRIGRLHIPNPSVECLGCKLMKTLDAETDHFKQTKAMIVQIWLREDDIPAEDSDADADANAQNADDDDVRYNTTDVARALEAFDERNILGYARGLDNRRRRLMASGPFPHEAYDREFDERQRRRTGAQNGRLGYKLMAPEVGAYELYRTGLDMTAEEKKWWDFEHQRYRGFGNYLPQP